MTRILLTGATGVIGSEVVPRLLQTTDAELRLLLRASSPEHLGQRLAELFDYWRDIVPRDVLHSRVTAVAGDVGRPWLGMAPTEYDDLTRTVTGVIHCAGNVKLNQTWEQARANAVAPARHVIEFARACQANGQLRKIDVVSTIGVAGKMPGLIPERQLTETREFHNTYEAAKAEAEVVFFDAIAEGLPLTIHRPSMVVGDSRTGRVKQFQVFYYLCDFLSGAKTRGLMVDLGDATLDIVPVDYVAAAIVHSSQSTASAGQVFHLCSGPEKAVRLKELASLLRRLAAARGDRVHRPVVVPRGPFNMLVKRCSRVAWGRLRRSLQTLPYFIEYLETRQRFDVKRTTDFLRSLGCDVSPPAAYVERVTANYREDRTMLARLPMSSSAVRCSTAVSAVSAEPAIAAQVHKKEALV